MSLKIYINNSQVQLTEGQTISYNLSNFDITDIGNRKLSYTNSFKIPRAGNESIFGFASSYTSASTTPYDTLEIDVIADGIRIINKGSAYIESYSEGFYTIQVTDSKDIISLMKETTLKSLYHSQTQDFVDVRSMLLSTTGIKLDFILSDYIIENYAADNKYIWENYKDNLSIFVKSVFQRFATVNSLIFNGGLWDDPYFSGLRMLVYFAYWESTEYAPYIHHIRDIVLNPDKTFYDLFKLVIQVFGAKYAINGTTITMRKIDSISLTDYVDWSDKLIKVNNKMFTVPNTSQRNLLRYSPKNNAPITLNETNITSNNKNITYEKELLTFNSDVYPVVKVTQFPAFGVTRSTIYISKNDATGTENKRDVNGIVLITDGMEMSSGVIVGISPQTEAYHYTTTLSSMHFATYFNSANEYALIEEMLTDPVFVEAEMFLNIIDIMNFDQYKLVFIKQLGGLYYVNSITDYLLNSKDKTAKVELIRI